MNKGNDTPGDAILFQSLLAPETESRCGDSSGSTLGLGSNSNIDVSLEIGDGDLFGRIDPTSLGLSPGSLAGSIGRDDAVDIVDVATNDGGRKQSLTMQQWTEGALRSLGEQDAKNKMATSSSPAYVACALKIARSLAHQLCRDDSEAEGGAVAVAVVAAQPQQYSWSDLVTVYVNQKSGEGGDHHQRDGSCCDPITISSGKTMTTHGSGSGSATISGGGEEKKDSGGFHSFGEDTAAAAFAVGEQNLQPLPMLRKAPSSESEDLQAMLNSIIPDQSLFLEDEDDNDNHQRIESNRQEGGSSSNINININGGENGWRRDQGKKPLIVGIKNWSDDFLFRESSPNPNDGEAELTATEFGNFSDPTTIDYLNVSTAELPTEYGAQEGEGEEDERMRIYALGLVFIELFAGGKGVTRGWPELLSSGDNSGAFKPPVNVGTAMNIIESLGEDDELFGDFGEEETVRADGRCAVQSSVQSKKRRGEGGNINGGAEDDIFASVERLVSMGLPFSLCQLIRNMIGCLRGDFSEDETYSTMDDVARDLRLLIDSPGVYLDDLDLDEACRTGLQRDDDGNAKLFGRDAESVALKESYLRSILSEDCEVAIVMGAGGIGKSSLSQELIRYAMAGGEGRSDGCILLWGKFDQLHQSQPFSAVASAFDRYCEWLSNVENSSIAEEVSRSLKEVLGHEANAFTKIIPNLSKIVDTDVSLDDNHGVGDAEKRLRSLLCQFVQIICRSHDAPVIFFLDDLQWADAASISLMSQVLMVLGSNRFFFIGSCRNDEMKEDHPLWKMLLSVRDFGVTTTKIELDCLDRESVNSLISHKLKLLPRLTRPLADIVFHKTKGNPFFVGQLLIELSRDGQLCPSLSRRRWVWEEDKIQERELSNDVLVFMTASLSRLAKEVHHALEVLSCFGASSDCSLVEKLEMEIENLSLSGPLNTIIAEGFLFKKDNKYFFAHDRVQEAVYKSMKPEEQCLCHFKYGMALCDVATRDEDESLYVFAVGQINLGGLRAVSDDEQRIKVARLNLVAGEKTKGMLAYDSAYWFFDHGISFLKNGNWETHYELSLALYNSAAETALADGEKYSSLDILISQVLHYARCLDDKLIVLYFKMVFLLRKGKGPAAVQHGFSVLSQIGALTIDPKNITPELIVYCLANTKRMLAGNADQDLLNYKVTHDPKKIITMRFLMKISQLLSLVSPSDQPVVILQMVQLSLEDGMTSLSPLGFCFYGLFLASMGDIREGYRFANLSKTLLDKIGSHEIRGEVLAYSTQVIAYIEPIQSVSEHLYDPKLAMSKGNTRGIEGNTTSLLLNATTYYWSGAKLSRAHTFMEEVRGLIKHHKHLMLHMASTPLARTISTLIGSSAEEDQNCAEDRGVASTSREDRMQFPAHATQHFFNKMFIPYLFRRFEETKAFAVKYSDFKIKVFVKFIHGTMQSFYEGLVSYWIGREENNKKWIAKGNVCRLAMEMLTESSKWNFENKYFLLQAEFYFCDRDFEQAETFYDAAISSAREHRFLNEEALAMELAGVFYLETGKRSRSIPLFSSAVKKYREWEAFAKADSLEAYLEEISSAAP